jgi:aspartate racemase
MIYETVQYTLESLTSEGKQLYVGLLATQGTYASEIYQKVAKSLGIDLFIPDDTIKQLLMEAIYALKSSNYEALPHLQDEIFAYLNACKLSGWILGCTELPIILKDGIDRFSLVDSSMVLAKASIKAVGSRINSNQ